MEVWHELRRLSDELDDLWGQQLWLDGADAVACDACDLCQLVKKL